MEDIYSWFLAILVIIAFFVPKILGLLFTIGTIGSAIWAIAEMPTFMSMQGKINRGFRVSSKPLSRELRHYLDVLSGDIIDYKETSFGKDMAGFIRKQEREVLVHVKRWYGFRWRRAWPFIGYINLSLPNPVLEIRSSLPFHLFLISLSLSIILIPFIVGIYAFSYSVETQSIEKYLQSKVEAPIIEKVRVSS